MPYEVQGDLNCWIWTGVTTRGGTPIVRDRHGCTTARRSYWKREHGAIPEGKVLIAMCREPLCVNPDHCEPVDWGEWAYRIGRSKLDRKRAGLALRMRIAGYSQAEVGDHFNVSADTIRRLERGEHWTQREAVK